ncbi:hypothetical protein IIA95_03655, partial [Patescibacteria group bacterium]|nr:hypothetical protein [Patescibacteria group bacterium]
TTDFIITSGTITAPTLLTIAGNYTNNGTFTDSSGTVYFTGTSKTLGGTMTGTTDDFNTIEFLNSGSWTFNANASTTVFTITSGTVTVSSQLVTISGVFTNNGTFTTDASSLLYFAGSGNITGTLTGTSQLRDVEILASRTFAANASTTAFTIASGATLTAPTLLSIAGNYTNNGDFTDGGGSNAVLFDGTSAQTIAGQMTGTADDFNHVEFLGAGSKTFSANASSTDFTIDSGAGTIDVTGRLITIAGNYTGSILATSTATRFYFTGTSKTLSGTMTGSAAFADVEFLNSGSWTFNANATTTSFIITSGTVTAPSGHLSISSDFTNSGTFTNNSGTVIFDGSGTSTITGATTWNNFTVVVAGKAIEFQNGVTQTFNGLLKINGVSGNLINLFSDSPPTQWTINHQGTEDVSFARIKDSACSGTDITTSDSEDAGNNGTCWVFAVGNPTISSDTNQVFEVSQAATVNSPITVTDNSSPTITTANDLRIAIATSSVDMLWDTSSTTAGFSGTASGKVSNPVSYEGGGSVLVIPVDTNFAGSDTLIISDLLFISFNTVNAAVSALDIFKDGPSDQTSDADDDKTIAIKGTFALVVHDAGQEANKFNISGTSVTAAELFAFKLTPTGEDASITNLVFQLSGVSGFASGDITNATTTIDYGGDGAIDAGDEEVGGTGVVSISGSTGTITFSTEFAATTTRNYILKADVAGIDAGDEMVFKLFKDDITSQGVTSSENIDATGSLAGVNHNKPAGGGGGGTGGEGPAGAGEETGGGGGAGEEIGDESGFLAPTALGATSTWATASNAFTSDDADATETTADDLQDYRDFSFNVPSGNEITGIEVKLEASASTAAGTIEVALSEDEGISTTTVKATPTLTTTDTVYRLGGSSDQWGITWTPSETNNTNFRLRLVGQPSGGNTVRVDAIQVKVFHQTTGGGGGGGGGVFKRLQQFLAQLDGLVENLVALVARLP